MRSLIAAALVALAALLCAPTMALAQAGTAQPVYCVSGCAASSISTVNPTAVTPSALTSYNLAAANTAQNAITIASGSIVGGYICNPATATGEGIATAENIYVNPFTTASTTEGNGNTAIVPGQCYTVIPGTKTSVSWVAATIHHLISGAQYQ